MSHDAIFMLGAGVVILVIWLTMHRWFWLVLSGISALAAIFMIIACIVHFRIVDALVACLIAAACCFMFVMSWEDGLC